MRIFLASVFLFIFSLQILPVKEIGKILFKGTMTEEIHEALADIDDEGCEIKKQNDPYSPDKKCPFYHKLAILTCSGLSTNSPASMSKQFIADIVTPPPNVG